MWSFLTCLIWLLRQFSSVLQSVWFVCFTYELKSWTHMDVRNLSWTRKSNDQASWKNLLFGIIAMQGEYLLLHFWESCRLFSHECNRSLLNHVFVQERSSRGYIIKLQERQKQRLSKEKSSLVSLFLNDRNIFNSCIIVCRFLQKSLRDLRSKAVIKKLSCCSS